MVSTIDLFSDFDQHLSSTVIPNSISSPTENSARPINANQISLKKYFISEKKWLIRLARYISKYTLDVQLSGGIINTILRNENEKWKRTKWFLSLSLDRRKSLPM